MTQRKIFWLCGPEEYRNTGIGKYSGLVIPILKKTFLIYDFWFHSSPLSIFRVFYQYFLIPFFLTGFPRSIKVLYDEGWLPILIIFPITNVVAIIHDVRNFDLTSQKPSFLQKIYFFLIKYSFRRLNSSLVKKIIVPSYFTKSKLLELGIYESKIEVIYNPFDKISLSSFSKLDTKKFLFEKYAIPLEYTQKFLILNVGTEEDRKNIITLLKALKILGNDFLFIKIGAPIILKNRLTHEKFINDNNLNHFFLGHLDNQEDLFRFYAVSDVYVSSSIFEGFGRTPIEAQLLGCPVISTDAGGLREVLGDSCLLIDNPLDFFEIAEKIKRVIYSETLRYDLVKQGYGNTDRFTLQIALGKWENIFRSL